MWIPSVPLVVLLGLLDLFISVFALGLYLPNLTLRFSFDVLFSRLLLKDGYSFFKSPFDFVALALIRNLLLVLAIVLKFRRVQFSKVFQKYSTWGCAIFLYSYCLVKLLALAEYEAQLMHTGLWIHLAWNALTFILVPITWSRNIQENVYEPLVEEQETSANSNEENNGDTKLSALDCFFKLCRYTYDHWPVVLIACIFLFLFSLANVFMPQFVGDMLSSAMTKDKSIIIDTVLALAGLTVAVSIFGAVRGSCFTYLGSLLERRLRLDLFSSLAHQEIAFFDKNQSGELISRLSSDCASVSSTLTLNINVITRSVIMSLGSLVFMFYYSWRLTVVPCIFVPLLSFVTQLYGEYYNNLVKRAKDLLAKATGKATEVLSTMRTVRSFACEEEEIRNFEAKLDDVLRNDIKKSLAYAVWSFISYFNSRIILVMVLAYGGYLVFTGRMSQDALLKILLYQMQLTEYIYWIMDQYSTLMESIGSSRKIFELIEREPQMLNKGSERAPIQGNVSFESVSFVYPTRPNNIVLEDLNLFFSAGQTVALVGPSGGGKSSIVSLLEHFYSPAAGRITVDSVNIEDFDHSHFHEKIALVAQEPVLYNTTIRENILYGCHWATELDMIAAAKMANAHDFIMDLEKKYETNCGEKGLQMSGGQKQRIAIARALVRRPAVLLLDEATSALDAESEALVQDALNRCRTERTLLIIAHRLSTIEKADLILVINKGKLVQKGSHSELMEDHEGLYYSLVSKQLLGISG